jgi:hypothetical protein
MPQCLYSSSNWFVCFFVLFLSLPLMAGVFRLMVVWILQLAQVIEKYNIIADNI